MIWQLGRVVDSSGGSLTVAISAPDHCRRCARGTGCGAGVFSQLFSRRATHLIVPAQSGIATGDRVRLGVAPSALAASSAAHYGLALAGLLAGAWLGHRLGPRGFEDVMALGAGLAGLALLVGPLGRRLPLRLNPVVERLSCSESDAKSSSISS
jgi:positive regulator of sigma E activity